jgi:hypothetical protein
MATKFPKASIAELGLEQLVAGLRARVPVSPVIPSPSWSQAAWFIDPQNLTGLASDGNDGLTALTPVRTWNGGVIARLGTYSPRIRQNTTHTFLSSHVDNTDPVIYGPYIENGAQITIKGTQLAGTASTLGVVTAKNRATNTPLSAATLVGATVGQMVVNTTKGNSRAWVQRSLGAGAFQLTQPFVAQTVPAVAAPGEIDTWATGDTVSLITPVTVNIERLFGTFLDPSGTFNNALCTYNLTALDPIGVGSSVLDASTNSVNFLECNIQRFLALSFPTAIAGAVGTNSSFSGGVLGGALTALTAAGIAYARFIGGTIGTLAAISNAQLDGDIIINCGSLFDLHATSSLGLVAIDTGTTINIVGSVCNMRASAYAGNVVYGPGILNVAGPARLVYPSGAGAAVAAFPLTPRLRLNGGTTGNSLVSGAPNVTNGGITLTAAALDAAAGVAGFGGNAFNFGGASIVNSTP